MSAVLANASANFEFNGAHITLACSSPEELLKALGTFGVATSAANDPAAPGKSKPAAATAPAGSPASPTAAPSAQPAAAPAAQGDAGNATPAAGSPAAAASPASSSTPAASPEEIKAAFDALKKAFLALSTKADGRAKCEGVLKPFGLAKLSEAKPEQYAAVLAAIEEASK